MSSYSFPYVIYYEINSTNRSQYSPSETLYYEKEPNFIEVDGNMVYQPPPNSDFENSEGYIIPVYKVGPFQPSAIITTTIPVENSQVDIMEYSYNLSDADLTQPITPYLILDLLFLQNFVFTSFSLTFLTDINCQTTVLSLMQIVRRMCNLTPTNMHHPLCCFTTLPFYNIFYDEDTSMRLSPCTNSYLDCTEGWYGYCTKPENYDNMICQDFYAGSYLSDGTLDFRARDTLEFVCQSIYKNTLNKDELDDNYLNFCGCYLPYGVYYDFQEKYDLINANVGMIQCWYLPCINSSFPPIQHSSNPCPSSEISNCIQDTYISLGSTGTGNINSNNIIVNQTIEQCKGPEVTIEPAYEVNDENNAEVNLEAIQQNNTVHQTVPPNPFVPVSFTEYSESQASSVNIATILTIIFICVGILCSLICFIKSFS
jgi:hypothetical protein